MPISYFGVFFLLHRFHPLISIKELREDIVCYCINEIVLSYLVLNKKYIYIGSQPIYKIVLK